MIASTSKRLEVCTRAIYNKFQGLDTKQIIHKKIEREKRLGRENDYPYQKISSREPGRFIKVAGMPLLEMQAMGYKYVNDAYFDTNYGTPIGLDNRCSRCISNIMDDFIVPLVECNLTIKGFRGTRNVRVNIGVISW